MNRRQRVCQAVWLGTATFGLGFASGGTLVGAEDSTTEPTAADPTVAIAVAPTVPAPPSEPVTTSSPSASSTTTTATVTTTTGVPSSTAPSTMPTASTAPASSTTTIAATTVPTATTVGASRLVVPSGATWAALAAAHRTNVPALLALNQLRLTGRPLAGTVLTLPPRGPLPTGTWRTVQYRARGAHVAAIQRALIASGIALRGGADGAYGRYTTAAVRFFQTASGLRATGGVDRATAIALGLALRAAPVPPTTTPSAIVGEKGCPARARGAVIDRDRQVAWLCRNGQPLAEFPITSARSQPDPRAYRVWSKSRYARAAGVQMQHFTVFARGEEIGARVGFHSVPTWNVNRQYIQPLDSVGSLAQFGNTHGCIRVRPPMAATIFGYLTYNDIVVVIS